MRTPDLDANQARHYNQALYNLAQLSLTEGTKVMDETSNLKLKSALNSPILLMLSIGLIVFGVRLNLIELFASYVPYWDDWGTGTILTWHAESGLNPKMLFSLANEHRGFFMKLFNLATFELNQQQWDLRLAMIASAGLWAATGMVLIHIAMRSSRHLRSGVLIAALVLVWIYPLSMFNLLSTIQPYQYFMIFFVVVGCWASSAKPWSVVWWLGILCLLSAALTSGGGSFASIAVAVTAWIFVWGTREEGKPYITTAVMASILSVFAASLLLVQESTQDAMTKLQAESFFTSFFKVLAWPASNNPWLAVFFIAPILVLLIRLFQQPASHNRTSFFALSLAAFTGGMALSIAYARNFDSGAGPAGRYFDFLVLYSIASFISLLLIQSPRLRLPGAANGVMLTAWVLAFASSAPYQWSVTQFDIQQRKKLTPKHESIVSAFALTDDVRIFSGRGPLDVPFPDSEILAKMIREMKRMDTLPYQFQVPKKVPKQIAGSIFANNGVPEQFDNRYRKYENVIGSFNLWLGAQHAKGGYISEVFNVERPYTMVPHLGYVGLEGISLKLVGEDTGKEVAIVPPEPDVRSGFKWRETMVPSLGEPFRIVATDDDTDLWLGFAAPRSVGRLSYYVPDMLAVGNLLWKLGVLLLLLLLRHDLLRIIKPHELSA